jgi:hypothetical protein
LEDGPPTKLTLLIQTGFLVSRPTFRISPQLAFNVRGYHPLRLTFPGYSNKRVASDIQALSLSLAATREISVDFFSCRYLDVSVPYVRFS